jgi:hypothetical protein
MEMIKRKERTNHYDNENRNTYANDKEDRKGLVYMIMRTGKTNANDEEDRKGLSIMIMRTGKNTANDKEERKGLMIMI